MDFYPGTDFEFANLARESQVIWLAMEGNTDKTIAQLLDITTDTVATYWKRILFRFESSSRTEVVAEFLREYYEEDLDRLEGQVTALEQKLKERDAVGQQQQLAAAQLNSLMNLLDVGVLFTNGGLSVSYVNEQLCRMAGCTLKPKELIGHDISQFINNCENRALSFDMTSEKKIRSLATSPSEKTVDRIAMTDGRTFERTLSNVMVRGSTIGHFIVYKDITSLSSENLVLQNIGKLSEAFVDRILAHYNSESNNKGHEISMTLGAVGKLIGADQAMIAEIDHKRGIFTIIHAWIRNEFEERYAVEGSIPLSFVGWFLKQATERESWTFDTVSNLPKSATTERSIFLEANIQSGVSLAFSTTEPDKRYFVQFSSQLENQFDRKIIDHLVPLPKLLASVIGKNSHSAKMNAD